MGFAFPNTDEVRQDLAGAWSEHLVKMHRGATHRDFRLTVTTALIVAAAYVVYQRVGTTAQADTVVVMRNVSGGFLAVGMTDRAPGFVVLSALDRDAVDIQADRYANAVAGDFTLVTIETPAMRRRHRLRGPIVIIVDQDGAVGTFPVAWSFRDFAAIRDGAGCTETGGVVGGRCGAPFADLFDMVATAKLRGTPQAVRRFLAPYARHDRNDAPEAHIHDRAGNARFHGDVEP